MSPSARPFANSLATDIEALVWLLAVQDEHNAGVSMMSDEFLITQVQPLVIELLGIRKKIEVIRGFRGNMMDQKYEREGDFKNNGLGVGSAKGKLSDDSLSVENIPVEMSRLSEEMAFRAIHGPRELTSAAFPKRTSPWKLHADKDVSPVQQHSMEEPEAMGHATIDEISRKTSIKEISHKTSMIEVGHRTSMCSADSMASEGKAKGDDKLSISICDEVVVGHYVIDERDATASQTIGECFQTLTIWRSTRMDRKSARHTATKSRPMAFYSRRTAGSTTSLVSKLPQKSETSPLQCIVLPPGSLRRTVWDLIALVLVIWDCIRIPLEFIDLPTHRFLTLMVWVVRLFWTVDLAFNFITGYVNKHGLSETRLTKIFKRYANTWLAPDMLLVAVDWADVVIESSRSETGLVRVLKSTRVTRSLRALRLVRMGKAMQFMNRSRFSLASDTMLVVVEIMKILFCFVLFTHLIACLWCGLGASGTEHGAQTWIDGADMLDEPIGSRYLVSCIWALAQFSGGTDFPLPQNVEERLFNTITLLICFVAAAAFVSFLTRSTTKLLLLSSGPSHQMRQLRNYLAQNRVSMRLMQRIQKNAHFIAFEQRSATSEEDVGLLHRISVPLQAELAMEIRGPVLTVHPFFESYRRFYLPGMRQLCEGASKSKTVASDDLLFMMGERQSEPHMFFVYTGTMSYQRPSGVKNTISPGKWIAEMVLWTDWAHRGTLTALSNCQVISVHAKKFYDILRNSDFSLEAAVLYATEFVKHLNTIRSEDLTDLDWDEDRAFTFEDVDNEIVMLKGR